MMDADEQKRFNWIKNAYGEWEEHAFMIAQVELARAEVERLRKALKFLKDHCGMSGITRRMVDKALKGGE